MTYRQLTAAAALRRCRLESLALRMSEEADTAYVSGDAVGELACGRVVDVCRRAVGGRVAGTVGELARRRWLVRSGTVPVPSEEDVDARVRVLVARAGLTEEEAAELIG